MYFDSHIHSDGLGYSELLMLSNAGIKEVCSLAFYPVKPRYPQTMIDVFRKLVDFETLRCKAAGIKMYPAVGIHPRCIPPDYEFVLQHLEAETEAEWIAFGEIGLELLTNEEIEVFTAQLRIAKKLDIPCIIHTPRSGKVEATVKTLEILEKLNFPQELAVIDHVNFQTLDILMDSGYWIGLTVQPGKLEPDEAARIVAENGSERFMLNSDAGYREVDVTSIVEAAKKVEAATSKEEMEKVSLKNARKFLRV